MAAVQVWSHLCLIFFLVFFYRHILQTLPQVLVLKKHLFVILSCASQVWLQNLTRCICSTGGQIIHAIGNKKIARLMFFLGGGVGLTDTQKNTFRRMKQTLINISWKAQEWLAVQQEDMSQSVSPTIAAKSDCIFKAKATGNHPALQNSFS